MTTMRKLFGELVPVDEAFEACGSSDLNRMYAALGSETNAVDRHFLLIGIVEQAWRRRIEASIALKLEECAKLHIVEFPKLFPDLRRQFPGVSHQPAYERLIALLTEQDRLAEAKALCQEAISVIGAPTYFSRLKSINRKLGSAR